MLTDTLHKSSLSYCTVVQSDQLPDDAIAHLITPADVNRITELACLLCNADMAVISLTADQQQLNTSAVLTLKEIAALKKFCAQAAGTAGLLEITDAGSDLRLHNGNSFNNKYLRFYAGCPLTDAGGRVTGVLCVAGKQPGQLSEKQRRGLTLLAGETAALIDERRAKAGFRDFEKLFEYSNDLMFVGGEDGYFKKINPAFQKILGWSPEYLLATSTFDFLHPDDAAITRRELDNLTAGKHTTKFVQRFRASNGLYRTIQWTSTPENSTGNIFGIGRDITDSYQLQEDLNHTRQMLEQTNQVARVGGWSMDVAQQKIYWTSVTKEIHGVPPDFIPDLATGINFYKEGESRNKIQEALHTALTEGKAWDVKLQIVNRQGQDVWVRALGNVEFENGKCTRLFGTFQDINDYQHAELALQRSVEAQKAMNEVLLQQIETIIEQDETIAKIKEFKFLADSVPQFIWTARPDGSVDYYNQHWMDYSGMPLPDELGALAWNQVVHPDDITGCVAAWLDAINTGKPYEMEYRLKKASDGLYKWHLGKAVPMRDENGSIMKWFGSCTDIDEYKRALNLENKISQYEDFNRIVAHNLRGPADSIAMLLGMLGEENDREEQQSLIAMLQKSSATLSQTLNELMKVLEVRNNHHLPYDECNLESLTSNIEQMLAGQFVTRQAVICTDFQCPAVSFPKLYLESIFYNMISNALKYSRPEAPPRIIITSARINDKVRLSFKDNGLGIDLAKHGHDVFNLNKTFHTGHDSKGVGLFMTKTQIETFGGQIRVESEPGKGSEFIVELQ